VTGNFFHVCQFGQNQAVTATLSGTSAAGCHVVQFIASYRSNVYGYANLQVVGNTWNGAKLFDYLCIGATRAYSVWVRAVTTQTVVMGVISTNVTTGLGNASSDFYNAGTSPGTNYGGINL
jgi:hypothetical protein